ncbi:hypothetical protein K504DRAFT_133757 [Pleomassaria siparia CBS 279.74]|uniref:Maintenance of telomere capping protein 6 n=1 Tax=Pleomassaria siparia CBS 279.74 TaxID=1314801 RepID=A0A6G1KLJ1_9PLEO|nr:hypothetical protein K504DRAFT_133757 [Pleomassaria siparia CBS 279.74]
MESWDEAFRTQRDVGLRIPINFVTVGTASLSAACFGHQKYEDAAFQKCFSNLLAAPFKRFVVDVYWDTVRSVWSLCPVQVPTTLGTDVYTVTTATATAMATAQSTASVDRRDIQEASTSFSSSSSSTPLEASSTGTPISSSPDATSSPTIPSFDQINNSTLLQIGSYQCTSSMTLAFLSDIYRSFLDKTATTTEATVTYLTLNVHAAASWQNSSTPAQQPGPDQWPRAGNLISDIVNGNLSDKIYTPQKLQGERSNLNGSWNTVSWENLPASGYYQTALDTSNHLTTQDGWPTEAYVEFRELYRLVAAFGSVDPQMAGYNITGDLETIFAPMTIHDYHQTNFSSTGDVTSGCLFSASIASVTRDTNSSYAFSTVPALNLGATPNTTLPIPSIANLTSCGLSPFLNYTLSNVTADQNPIPYVAFAHSTLWTWEPGMALNTTNSVSSATAGRCAAMQAAEGRWRTVDCTAHHLAACQSPNDPYHWELSATATDYYHTTCPSNTRFSVPHTALENSYLLSAIQSSSHSDVDASAIFLNLNALDVPSCWVVGVNGTCPYVSNTDTNQVRVVLVPTIAAVIIFLLAALTFFDKCAANRKQDRRGARRRNVGGWEYEGVPS